MSAVCPACGVAVVPGYVKCPKCQATLPTYARTHSRSTFDPGGTALEEKKPFPIIATAIAGVGAVVIIAYFGLRSPTHKVASQDVPITGTEQTLDVTPHASPRGPVQSQVTFDSPSTAATGPTPASAASELDHQLKRQRLWGTVEVIGTRVDVRSGACGDAAMMPLIENARAGLRSAGLTRLRCLEQSGRVAFMRDL